MLKTTKKRKIKVRTERKSKMLSKKKNKKILVSPHKENKPLNNHIVNSIESSSKQITGDIKKTRVRVIGVGGGGGSIVSELASKVQKATFVVANTDSQALKSINKKASKFQFGQSLTRGLGTGTKGDIAELASQNDREKIKKRLNDQDLGIFVASLGGGTGS